MRKNILHILCLGALVLMVGCAVYPAVQVAGGVLTGYDAAVMVDDYVPRQHVEGGGMTHDQDATLQRRLRERLMMQGLRTVSAHVIDRTAYLVGQFPDRIEADRAISVARSVQGVRRIQCKFFALASPRITAEDMVLLGDLNEMLRTSPRLRDMDLRVEVIQGNAILMGQVTTAGQKAEAVAIAHELGSLQSVVDYIVVGPGTVASK